MAVFTGLVEDLATVEAVHPGGGAAELTVRTRLAPEIEIGDSVALDGACLTVVARDGAALRFTAVAETLSRTTLGELEPGRRCNLERAMRLGDRLDGHLVQGHVDAVGRIARRTQHGDAVDMTFLAPADLLRYVAVKGSIAVDGISLTVTGVDDRGFGVALIPHTIAATTLGLKREGDRVNLEVDLVAKYLERLLAGRTRPSSRITTEFLREHGYT